MAGKKAEPLQVVHPDSAGIDVGKRKHYVAVDPSRFTGAVYRASGLLHVGTTRGRGRYDRDKLYDKPRKDVWLRPLRRNWKRILSR